MIKQLKVIKVEATTETTNRIAKVVHEANKAWCEANGDFSQLPFDSAPEWQLESIEKGIEFHRNNPDAGDSASHDCWLKHKKDAGWVYGEAKDEVAKTHPCMVPFDQLPDHQQKKDRLFRTIVHALL